MKVSYRRTTLKTKRHVFHIEDVEVELPASNLQGDMVNTKQDLLELLNRWNKRVEYNARAGLPIYVFTMN